MSYEVRTLQFSTENNVPGNLPFHPVDNPAPVKQQIGGGGHLWDLVFSFESGGFFLPAVSVPGSAGALIKSWYSQEGGPPGSHALSLVPFVVRPDNSGEFAQATNFVDFSEPSASGSAINTDTITHPTVTATVHASLPGPPYETTVLTSQSTSTEIIITTTTTNAVFDHIFVIYGGSVTAGSNMITVKKGVSCLALAVFKLVSSKSEKRVSTILKSKIPQSEWPQLIEEVTEELGDPANGTIYEHLNARQLASLSADEARVATDAINSKIALLGKIKTQIGTPALKVGAQTAVVKTAAKAPTKRGT